MSVIRRFAVILALAATVAVADPLSFENMGNPVSYARAAAYSPEGKYFVLGGMTTVLYDAKANKPLKLLGYKRDEAVAVEFSKDGKLLAVEYLFFSPPAKDNNDLAHEIVVYSMPDGKQLHRFQGLDSGYNWRRRLRISPDGTKIATSNSKQIAVYDIKTGKVVWQWLYDRKIYPTWSYASFDCTPDWKYFLFNLIRISYPDKNVEDKTKWSDEKRPFFWGNIISHDGKRALAYGGGNGVTKKIFELETGKLITKTDKHGTNNVIPTADFSTFYFDSSIWTPAANKVVHIEGSNSRIRAVSQDGILIFGNTMVTPKDMKEKKAFLFCEKWKGSNMRGFGLNGFTPEGPLMIYPSYSRSKLTLDLKTGAMKELKEKRTYGTPRPEGYDYSVQAFSPDKKMGMTTNGKLVYPKASKKEGKSIFPEGSKKVWGTPVFLSADRAALRTGDKFHLHDIATGKTTAVDVPAQRSGHLSMKLSSDGKWLVSLDGDWKTYEKQLVCVHNSKDLACVGTFELSPKGGYIFSPDNKWFATFSGQSTKLYKVGEWKLVRELKVPFGRISGAAVAADAKHVVAQINNRPCVVFAADGSITGYLVDKDKLLDPKGQPVRK